MKRREGINPNWVVYETYLRDDGQYVVCRWGERDEPLAVCPTYAAALAAERHASGITMRTSKVPVDARVALVSKAPKVTLAAWSSTALVDPWGVPEDVQRLRIELKRAEEGLP